MPLSLTRLYLLIATGLFLSFWAHRKFKHPPKPDDQTESSQ